MGVKLQSTQKVSTAHSYAAMVTPGPVITSVVVTDSSYTALDDTAVSTAGGYIKVFGTLFESGCVLYVGGVAATSTAFISSSEIRCQLAATTSNTQVVYVVNPSGSAAVYLTGIVFSGVPAWSTAASLPSAAVDGAFSISLAATSDSAITYTLAAGSSLPPGTALSSAGVFSGTVTGIAVETTYSFNIVATDLQLQDTARTFSITFSVGDAYFKSTVLLLNGETANLNWMADASTNSFAITPVGDSKPSAFSPYNTNWSNYFDGTGDYLTVPTNAAFQFGTGDFTIEAWIYNTSAGATDKRILCNWGGGANAYQFYLRTNNRLIWQVYTSNSPDQAALDIPLNVWTHVAWSKSGSNAYLFINGVLKDTTVLTQSANGTGTNVAIGSDNAGGSYFFGNISNLRVVKGTAVYTADFTPPTAPLTAISGTQLLTCQSNRFIDNSTNAFAITANGNTATKAFGPLTETDLTTGSGYFNTASLSSPSSSNLALGSGNFTVECWVYNTGSLDGRGIFQTSTTTGINSSYQLAMAFNNATFFVQAGAGNQSTTGVTVVANRWYHLALVKSGSTLTLYVDGVNCLSRADTFTYTDTYITIGGYFSLTAVYALNGYISNFSVTKGTAVYTANFTPPTAPLAANANTQLLTLQNRIAHNNNTAIDTSGNRLLGTKFANATLGTFSPFSQPNGYWSNYFDGTGDYLALPSSANLAPGSVFTFEAWIYIPAIVNSFNIYAASNNNEFQVGFNGSSEWGIATRGTAWALTTTTLPALNQWNHIVACRGGTGTNQTSLFLNGVRVANGTVSAAYSGTSAYQIAANGAGAGVWNGYISNLRLVQGTDVYGYTNTTITVPTAPLTAVSGTQLLTCQSNRFIDNSTNAIAITRSGDTLVQSFSPFAPAAVYSATTNGGSGYYDGTGDYHSFPLAITNLGNFTFECWVYGTNNISGMAICGSSEFELYLSTLTVNWVYQGIINVASGLNLVPGQWNHIVVCRYNWVLNAAGLFKIFVNGVMYSHATAKGENMPIPGPFITGGSYYTNAFRNPWPGYISNVRFVSGNGTIYTANFTPPSAPVTTTNDTILMLNFTTGGVIDATGRNDLETVGDARISTAVKKYNTGSIYFDGTGDHLYGVSNPTLAFGTGDFTVETWIYMLAIPGSGTPEIVLIGDWHLNFRASGTFAITSDATVFAQSPISLVTGQWYHIAAVRSSGSTKIYVDGVGGTAVACSTNFITGPVYIGGQGSTFNNCYMDDLRITKGVARYTATFTPPTAAILK